MKKLSSVVLSMCLIVGPGSVFAADTMGKDSMSKDPTAQGSMSTGATKSEMKKGEMKKHHTKKHEKTHKSGMSNGSMGKEGSMPK